MDSRLIRFSSNVYCLCFFFAFSDMLRPYGFASGAASLLVSLVKAAQSDGSAAWVLLNLLLKTLLSGDAFRVPCLPFVVFPN